MLSWDAHIDHVTFESLSLSLSLTRYVATRMYAQCVFGPHIMCACIKCVCGYKNMQRSPYWLWQFFSSSLRIMLPSLKMITTHAVRVTVVAPNLGNPWLPVINMNEHNSLWYRQPWNTYKTKPLLQEAQLAIIGKKPHPAHLFSSVSAHLYLHGLLAVTLLRTRSI